MEKSEYKES